MKNIYENNYAFDEPVSYMGLKIYPVRLKEYLFFSYAVDCLLIDKNSIPDAKVISMSYLDYLLSADPSYKYAEKLGMLIAICMKEDADNIKYRMDERNKYILLVSNIEIKSGEFEEIKKIILEQNLVEVPDFSIQKEIRDKIEEGKRLRSKTSKNKMGSFEDQLISLSVATGFSLETIYEMTYRKFIKSISRMDLLMHYKIYLQSSMSGMVSFKDTSFIKHWLTETEIDKNSDMIALDDMQKKINFEDIKDKK